VNLTYMLDADACIHLIRRRSPELYDRFRRAADKVAVSTIVRVELLLGVEKALVKDRAAARVQALLTRLSILPFDEAAADHAARIRAGLEAGGSKIGAYDSLIAGHARSEGLVLITGNLREFSRVPGLLVEDWTSAPHGVHEA
jgi:tRNA(fMet)-specific endonuclease VapC